MTETNYRYFERRAAEERAAAALAVHSLARKRHLELAARYDEAAAENTAQVLECVVEPRVSGGARV
jgi:hypothetical protein